MVCAQMFSLRPKLNRMGLKVLGVLALEKICACFPCPCLNSNSGM